MCNLIKNNIWRTILVSFCEILGWLLTSLFRISDVFPWFKKQGGSCHFCAYHLLLSVTSECYTCWPWVLHLLTLSATPADPKCYTCWLWVLHLLTLSATHVDPECYTCWLWVLHLLTLSATPVDSECYTCWLWVLHLLNLESDQMCYSTLMNSSFVTVQVTQCNYYYFLFYGEVLKKLYIWDNVSQIKNFSVDFTWLLWYC